MFGTLKGRTSGGVKGGPLTPPQQVFGRLGYLYRILDSGRRGVEGEGGGEIHWLLVSHAFLRVFVEETLRVPRYPGPWTSLIGNKNPDPWDRDWYVFLHSFHKKSTIQNSNVQ